MSAVTSFAVDCKDVLTLLYVQSGFCQRRPEIRVPVQSAVDLLQPVPVVLYAEVSAKQSSPDSLWRAQPVAAAYPVVTNSRVRCTSTVSPG